jgi:hypothetical protein
MSIDLLKVKDRKNSVLNLKKQIGIESQKSQVVLALDYSGSMSQLYSNGTVQDTVERILPFGLGFDDNGEVDFYLFENKFTKIAPITLKNLDDYINRDVLGKYQMGGTEYAPVLKAIYNDFVKKSNGFLGFGSTKVDKMDIPVYVIFITDGENSDKNETEQIIRKMSESGFFIQFIGIGNESFRFLSKLDDLDGRKIDNANFFKCQNITHIADDELYKLLMTEFPSWLKEAKQFNLIA